MCSLSPGLLCILPSGMRAIADLVGIVPALALAEHFGGLTLRVPAGANRRAQNVLHDLAAKIGPDAARLLASRYAGAELYVPNCKNALARARHSLMLADRSELASQGCSEREIVRRLSRKYRLSDRYVWRLLKRPAPDCGHGPAQATLPGLAQKPA